MSEEEKKAIEWLKNANFFSARIYAPSILNIIERQQKEIEKLKEPKYMYNATTGEITKIENEKSIEKYKEKVKQLEKENEELKVINNMQKYRIEVIDERELISKDTIREKIKKYEKLDKEEYAKQGNFETEISLLKELLEE